ncbi:MAG: nucleotidyltransferase family protein [Pseudomonadota bacterium]
MTPECAMVFAAGLGTRMRPLTLFTPKPLIEIGGRTLLDRTLDLLCRADVPRAVVNTHHLAQQIALHLKDRTEPEIRLSHEDVLLDTGGGMKHAAALLGQAPLLTLNADAVFSGDPVAPLMDRWDPARMDALLLLVPRENALSHKGAGDFALDPEDRLIRRGRAPIAPFVYTGVQVVRPERIYAWPEEIFSLNLVWDAMIADGRAYGAVMDGTWCDVGHVGSLPLAEAMVR